jgi:hypothetical protein
LILYRGCAPGELSSWDCNIFFKMKDSEQMDDGTWFKVRKMEVERKLRLVNTPLANE